MCIQIDTWRTHWIKSDCAELAICDMPCSHVHFSVWFAICITEMCSSFLSYVSSGYVHIVIELHAAPFIYIDWCFLFFSISLSVFLLPALPWSLCLNLFVHTIFNLWCPSLWLGITNTLANITLHVMQTLISFNRTVPFAPFSLSLSL